MTTTDTTLVVIGILGGVASGKSEVSQRLGWLGAEVLDADRLGHEVLREAAVRQAVQRRWGQRVMDSAGEIDRRKLAEVVFATGPESTRDLAYLEGLTHPRIGQRLCERLAELRGQSVAAAVLDAPVMLKAGWDRLCQRIIFVDAPRSIRLARARRRGWTETDFSAREAAQESVEVKRRRADTTFDNATSREQLYAQIDRFWQSLFPARGEPAHGAARD